MKLSYVLLNFLLVGAGIMIYDMVKGSPEAPASAPHYDPLQADDVGARPAEQEDRGVLLDGGGQDILARRNANRIDDLESQIAVLTRRREAAGSSDDAQPPVDAPPLAVEDVELGSDGEPTRFDEKTLQTIEHYMDEINRRKMVERQRNRIAGELERLGVDLAEGQRDKVVDLTLSYQQKARDLLRRTFTRDDKGREERRQAYDSLRQEYQTALGTIVPASEAEKISASRLSRGLGVGPGEPVGGGRRGRDRGGRQGGGGD